MCICSVRSITFPPTLSPTLSPTHTQVLVIAWIPASIVSNWQLREHSRKASIDMCDTLSDSCSAIDYSL